MYNTINLYNSYSRCMSQSVYLIILELQQVDTSSQKFQVWLQIVVCNNMYQRQCITTCTTNVYNIQYTDHCYTNNSSIAANVQQLAFGNVQQFKLQICIQHQFITYYVSQCIGSINMYISAIKVLLPMYSSWQCIVSSWHLAMYSSLNFKQVYSINLLHM